MECPNLLQPHSFHYLSKYNDPYQKNKCLYQEQYISKLLNTHMYNTHKTLRGLTFRHDFYFTYKQTET